MKDKVDENDQQSVAKFCLTFQEKYLNHNMFPSSNELFELARIIHMTNDHSCAMFAWSSLHVNAKILFVVHPLIQERMAEIILSKSPLQKSKVRACSAKSTPSQDRNETLVVATNTSSCSKCIKCGHEIKERPLLNDTFIGCMC